MRDKAIMHEDYIYIFTTKDFVNTVLLSSACVTPCNQSNAVFYDRLNKVIYWFYSFDNRYWVIGLPVKTVNPVLSGPVDLWNCKKKKFYKKFFKVLVLKFSCFLSIYSYWFHTVALFHCSVMKMSMVCIHAGSLKCPFYFDTIVRPLILTQYYDCRRNQSRSDVLIKLYVF